MRISLVVAADENNGIGYQQQMPWHLPADLRFFKSLTMGHHLIMGRTTYESFDTPLPGRTGIVVTRNRAYAPAWGVAVHSVAEGLEVARAQGETEVFLAGGREIYREGLKVGDRLYLTRVHHKFQTDVAFPEFDTSQWVEISRESHPADEKDPYPMTFLVYERKK